MALAGWMVSIKQRDFQPFENETKSHENLKLKRFSFRTFPCGGKLRHTVKRTVALITLRRDHFKPFVSGREWNSLKGRRRTIIVLEVHFVEDLSMDAAVWKKGPSGWHRWRDFVMSVVRHLSTQPCLSWNERHQQNFRCRTKKNQTNK